MHGLLTEIHLLRYPTKFLRAAVRGVRQRELRWLVPVGIQWVKLLDGCWDHAEENRDGRSGCIGSMCSSGEEKANPTIEYRICEMLVDDVLEEK